MAWCRQILVEIAKFVCVILSCHLYIYICAIAYTKLEVQHLHPLNETLDGFLIKLKEGQYANDDVTSVLQKYKDVKEREEEWSKETWFQSFPKTFVYVLAAHTTLGNRHMNVKTPDAQLFYFFTVPLGILLYFLMIHFVATKFSRMLKDAIMLVWRREDDPFSDRERDIFLRLKLALAMFTLTLITIVCFSSVALIFNRPYITELVYIIDALYTITSSENFVFYDFYDDGLNAFITTLVYFVLILSAYSTSYTVITVFTHHHSRDVFAFMFGNWVYQCCVADDEDVKTGIWDEYKVVPMGDLFDDDRRQRESVASLQSNTTWLHNDGNLGLDMSKFTKKESNGNNTEERYVDYPPEKTNE